MDRLVQQLDAKCQTRLVHISQRYVFVVVVIAPTGLINGFAGLMGATNATAVLVTAVVCIVLLVFVAILAVPDLVLDFFHKFGECLRLSSIEPVPGTPPFVSTLGTHKKQQHLLPWSTMLLNRIFGLVWL